MKMPRLMLAAGSSGSGKTLVTCGLLEALKRRGLTPAAFKCGPDYIDPMFHTRVLGVKSRNLDTFFAGRETVRYLLAKNSAGSSLAVMEGVMGYYDGVGGISTWAGAYDLADATETPAVLLVNSKGMSLSLLAYIKGFLEYKKDSRIRGVIFNRMPPMLYPRMKKLAEEELGVSCCGYVPELRDCLLESRHLGLVLPEEVEGLQGRVERLADTLEESLDIERLLELAETAPELSEECPENLCRGGFLGEAGLDGVFSEGPGQDEAKEQIHPVKVAVARDEAFCFLYEDNLQLLRELGAVLTEFSPLHDKELPEDVQGLILPGGYPELYARQLAENASMRESIREALESGLVCQAECGGFLYLQQSLEDMEGRAWPMVGFLEGRGYFLGKLSRFGYLTLKGGMAFGQPVGELPAHEFHYYDTTDNGGAFYGKKPLSSRGWECMVSRERLLAGFPHLYYYGNPRVVEAFLEKCREAALR